MVSITDLDSYTLDEVAAQSDLRDHGLRSPTPAVRTVVALVLGAFGVNGTCVMGVSDSRVFGKVAS